MTDIGHHRAAGELLRKSGEYVDTVPWIGPPTRVDEHQPREEGCRNVFGAAGARLEIPGCPLCRGNQARVKPGATVVSTSTRNFPNRLGEGEVQGHPRRDPDGRPRAAPVRLRGRGASRS